MTTKLMSLGELCDVRIGRTPRRDALKYWGGGGVWVTVGELNGGVLMDSREHITELALATVMPEPVPAGTLLFSFKLSIGKMAVAGVPLHTNEAIAALVIRDPSVIDRDFLCFALKATSTDSEANHAVLGKVLNKAKVQEIHVPVPSLDEQHRIVDLLSRAEGIVRLRRQAQQKAAALIPAIFVDMFGDPATNPKGWPVKHLGDLLSVPIRNGISPSKSGTVPGRVLTLSAITQGRFDAGAVKEANFAVPIAGGDEVRAVDFLVCRGNGNRTLVGAGCYPTHDMSGVAFPDTAIAVRPDPTLLNRAYFSALWGTAFIRQQIDSIAKTTNGTFKINQTGLAGVRVLVPAPERQLQFARLAEALQSIQSQQAIALEKAVATVDALLARAFSVQGAAEAIREAERALE